VRELQWAAQAARAMFEIHDGLFNAYGHEVAIRVVDGINATVGLLRDHPLLGRAAEMRNRREIVIGEYVVAYRMQRDNVRVLLVEHGSRRR
jgi:plasmid stabilization system protein ParE